jgi:hypothetical protein
MVRMMRWGEKPEEDQPTKDFRPVLDGQTILPIGIGNVMFAMYVYVFYLQCTSGLDITAQSHQ